MKTLHLAIAALSSICSLTFPALNSKVQANDLTAGLIAHTRLTGMLMMKAVMIAMELSVEQP